MHSKPLSPLFRILLLMLSLLLPWSSPVIGLTASLQATIHQQGQTLSLEVAVPAPPPSSIIAGIKLSQQVKIVKTFPASAKLDAQASHVKWLVKNPSPGKLRFTVTTSPAADLAKVSAEILYRSPGGGSLQKIEAGKR